MIASWSETTEGYYYVRPGDTARIVAGRVYGDKNKYGQLLKANPEIWEEGAFITVPGVSGRIDSAKQDESATKLIQRVFPNQPVHLFQKRFYTWNGGPNREFHEGDLIFIPDR